jgi:hypothetical protein
MELLKVNNYLAFFCTKKYNKNITNIKYLIDSHKNVNNFAYR